MTNDAPMETVLGQMAKNIAPKASSTCMTTQMLVVSARIRERRPLRTHSRETIHTNIRMRKRGTRLIYTGSPAGKPLPMPIGMEMSQMPAAATARKLRFEKRFSSVPK